jgi:hypothetical protein
MRKWRLALAAVAAAAFAVALIGGLRDEFAAAPSSGGYHMPAAPQAKPAAPSARPAQPARHFQPLYQRHRDQFLRVSDYSRRTRGNHVLAVIGFLLFAVITLPGNARGARAFYRQLVSRQPLPESAGADDENNRRARQVLFFYLLFLLYQVVQFPLTWGRDNAVQFYSDLGFQFVLLLGVVLAYRRLKAGVAAHWQGDADAKSRIMAWSGTRVEGLSVRWRDLSRLALFMFAGGFAPALLAKLPDWLDVLASY